MSIRRFVACLLAVIAIPSGSDAALAAGKVVVLVTEAESAAGKAAPSADTTNSMRSMPPRPIPNPNAPRIELLAPELAGRPLAVPFPISVRFVPSAGRDIDPGSFRILYGALGLDITSRILAATRVTSQRLDVPAAKVPKGSHRLLLEIRDDARNVGRREFEFEVVQ